MAHSCPDCGQTCYCGGDIDDILMEEGEVCCTHCDDCEENDSYFEDDDYDDLDEENYG